MPSTTLSMNRLPPLDDGPVDTHAHVFLRDLPRTASARYAPDTDAPDDAYLGMLDRSLLAVGFIVQPSFLGTDNGYLLESVARHPTRLRAVAVVPPTIAPKELALLTRSGVIGVRLNLIGRPVPPFGADPWRALLTGLSRAGLFVEIQAEGAQWLELRELLARDDLQIVIDHMGRPAHVDRDDSNLRVILNAAATPSVWVKLSAPYRFAANAKQVAAQLLKYAGASRMLWGSDWPWTQHPDVPSYECTLAWLDDWIPEPAMRYGILVHNPRRLIAESVRTRICCF